MRVNAVAIKAADDACMARPAGGVEQGESRETASGASPASRGGIVGWSGSADLRANDGAVGFANGWPATVERVLGIGIFRGERFIEIDAEAGAIV